MNEETRTRAVVPDALAAGTPDVLLHKADQDLARVKERFTAFWQGEVVDRVCIEVTAPREQTVPWPEEGSTEYIHTDPGFQTSWWNAYFANTYFGGEALPMAAAPGQLLYPAYGGRGSFASGTVWVEPTVTDGMQWADYRFDPANPFIEHIVRITKALAEDAPGRYLVANPGIFDPLDGMAQVRGMGDFVMELALPEFEAPIRQAHRECMRGFKYMSEAVYEAAGGDGRWFANSHLWAPGRINNIGADSCCLLGPKHFLQWVVPEIEEMTRFLEFNMYHLDGFDHAAHLPLLLEVKGLRGIQFIGGDGHMSVAEGMPVYRRIQQAGRVQYIWAAYEEVEEILRELDPGGLLIITKASDVEAADALLRNAVRWSTRRHQGRA